MEEIEIVITPSGKVSAKTKGIKGERCMDYADLLVQLLGKEVTREKTAEYYERDQVLLRGVDVKQRR